MDAKALAASKNHSETEKRRRERINNHLAKLRSLLPSTTKTDKASLLAEVIQHVKEQITWVVVHKMRRSKLRYHATVVGENVVGEEVPEAEVAAAPTQFTFNYSIVDVAIRILLFAAALSYVVVMVTSKQTEVVETAEEEDGAAYGGSAMATTTAPLKPRKERRCCLFRETE
ncbi:hypothetical protein F3Y22_tig00110458pilonHSYRG00111 [Hibiscus syriacus]|uniref:BHLH domain-containing protein n=1 Tax=Hibiscus syriacus TaxID=106335 RepID=A0A6A3AHW3_HIBSY|nr:hypothetical protein F3Y22_tig00110458pilonHSYRG00111 [Hibiscus syriacus]